MRLVAGIVAAASIAAAPQETPTFRAGTRLVMLHVTVTNRQRQVVTGLGRDAFTVYEDGRKQTISVFRNDDVPVSVGLLIDNSGSMRTLRPSVEAAALAFVRASNPMDDAFVVNFADKPRIDVPFTRDLQVLESGVSRSDSIGGTAMRDAVEMAQRYLAEHASWDRRALLLITDGVDNASAVAADRLRNDVAGTGTAIFAVRLVRADQPGTRKADEELERLAGASGGIVEEVASTADTETAVLTIAHDIRAQYTLAYAPAKQALDGTYRTVRVKVSGALSARTRPGYWAVR